LESWFFIGILYPYYVVAHFHLYPSFSPFFLGSRFPTNHSSSHSFIFKAIGDKRGKGFEASIPLSLATNQEGCNFFPISLSHRQPLYSLRPFLYHFNRPVFFFWPFKIKE